MHTFNSSVYMPPANFFTQRMIHVTFHALEEVAKGHEQQMLTLREYMTQLETLAATMTGSDVEEEEEDDVSVNSEYDEQEVPFMSI